MKGFPKLVMGSSPRRHLLVLLVFGTRHMLHEAAPKSKESTSSKRTSHGFLRFHEHVIFISFYIIWNHTMFAIVEVFDFYRSLVCYMCCCTTPAGMNGEVNSDLTSPAIPVKGWTATNISWFVSRASTFEDLNSGVWCLPWWTWSLGHNKFNTSGAQSRDLMKVGQQVATWSKRYASQLVCG